MSYNKSLFEGVPRKNVNKSRFDLSHEWKSQIMPGYLIPCLLLETLPQDEFMIDSEFMFRFNPLYFPVMHKMTMRADYYFIPNRILWPDQGALNSGWSKWIAEQNEQAHPTVDANMTWDTLNVNNLVLGYMGLPLFLPHADVTESITGLNAFPLSAYLKIWDEYYRVTQLEAEKWFPLNAGNNTGNFDAAFDLTSPGEYNVLRSKWEKDYFTSALPTPQIGDAIQIPLVDTDDPTNYPDQLKVMGTTTDATPGDLESGGGGVLYVNGPGQLVGLDIQEKAGTIKQLRLAEKLQAYYERIMKVGQRYRDFIKGLWGVDPEPGYVDVPILLGSRFGRVQIADVMTQAVTTVGENEVRTGDYMGQANLYANDNDPIRYECREHGWLMCILQVNPNTSYGQGVERFWRRSVQTDYPLDIFASIGDQEILKEEVFRLGVTAQLSKNEETFGYIPRFSEMRYKNNMHVMALNFTTGLSQHIGRYWDIDDVQGSTYDALIEINEEFVSVGNGTNGRMRISDVFRVLPSKGLFQAATEGVIYAHIFHTVKANRALPMFSTPSL